MKVQIIHNPGSGEDSHSKQEVEEFVARGSFSKVKYASTKEEGWENFEKNKPDLIFLAGGDGTVHKVASVLLTGKYPNSETPIHILPLGTANNIARTLDVITPFKLHAFKTGKELQKFDVGRVKGFKNQDFFLEGVGAGIFPALIAEMEDDNVETKSAAEKLKYTLQKLLRIVIDFKAQRANVKTAGLSISGFFLLVEVMNIKFIGPNFQLTSKADPGDGYFDLVLIPEEKRSELIAYVIKMLAGKDGEQDFRDLSFSMRIKEAEIKWGNSYVHVDDSHISDFSGGSFTVKIDPARLRFVRNP